MVRIITVWIFLEVFVLLPYFHAQHTNDHTHLAEIGDVLCVSFDNMRLWFFCLLALTSILTSWSVSYVSCAMSENWALCELCMGLPVVAPVKGLVLSRASWITKTSLLRKQQLDHCCREMQTQGWVMFDSLAVVAQQKKKKLFKGPLYTYRFCCGFQLILSGPSGKIKGVRHVCCIWSSSAIAKILKAYEWLTEKATLPGNEKRGRRSS